MSKPITQILDEADALCAKSRAVEAERNARIAATPPTFFAREARVSYLKRGEGERMLGSKITTSRDAEAHVRHAIGSPMVEHFVALALDSRGRVTAWTTVAIGTLTFCAVSPADVFRFAVLSGAASLIVAHNHPSGDPTPSPDDIALTRRLVDGSKLLGLRILDHVIIGDDGCFSFLDAGLLGA